MLDWEERTSQGSGIGVEGDERKQLVSRENDASGGGRESLGGERRGLCGRAVDGRKKRGEQGDSTT